MCVNSEPVALHLHASGFFFYKVAKIIANDLIQVYLEDRLNNINVKRGSDNSLKWTASKTALTELIYALYSHGVFNNGNTDIKLIAKTFEEAFN